MDFVKLNECLCEMYHRDLTYFDRMKQIQNLIAPQQKDYDDLKTETDDAQEEACENENT